MSSVAFDVRKIVQIAATALAGALALFASQVPSRAQTSHMLIIPASDGYGFDDCLVGTKACGRVIADAWCEAHGMAAAVSFGRSDDITASIADSASPDQSREQPQQRKLAPGTFVVNCKD